MAGLRRRIAVLLTIGLLLSLSACLEDQKTDDPPLLFTKPAAEEDPTEPSNIVPTQVPTVAPTIAPTVAPTIVPTVAPTEAPKPVKFTGWDILDPNKEFTRNADGLPILGGDYYKYWSNGFLIGSTGVDFLSVHSGEPIWIKGKQEQIKIDYEGTEYVIDLVWCSYMGEIGVNYPQDPGDEVRYKGPWVYPIMGNDRFVEIKMPTINDRAYIFLLDLQTMTLHDPLAKMPAEFAPSFFVLSPGADMAIVYVDYEACIWNLHTGALQPLEDLTGIESASNPHFVSATHISFLTSIEALDEQSYIADGALLDLTDGSVKTLYEDAHYGSFLQVGGLEHIGRMYGYFDYPTQKVYFVDTITGATAAVDYFHSLVGAPGLHGVFYCHDSIGYLVKTDGTVTPLFTTKADP